MFILRFAFPRPLIPISHRNPDNPLFLPPSLLQVTLPPPSSIPNPLSTQSPPAPQAPPSYWEAVEMKTDPNLPRYEELFGYSV